MGGSLYKWYQDKALMEGKKTTTSILPLAIDLREIERRRSKKQMEVEENPRLGWDFWFSRKCKKRRREKNSSLYRQWLWVPQLKSLKWARMSLCGLRTDSTKKEELIVEISTFQKVYILRVSETLKLVSRFCVKRLFYPYQWQSRV